MAVISILSGERPTYAGRGSLAAWVSFALHAAAVTVVAGSIGWGTSGAPLRHYQVQLIELRTPAPRHSIVLTFRPGQFRQPEEGRMMTRLASKGEARQTLIVPGAPADLELRDPIPAPLALPRLDLHNSEITSAPRLFIPDNRNAAETANILSLPDAPVQGVALVPKVDQSTSWAQASVGGSNASDQDLRDLVRIDLPPDGQFPASVLGPSMSDQYPDLDTGLRGKIVSTVYLNVGTDKSWPLEFWAAGAEPVEAPWAFEIYRPKDLGLPLETQAVLIAGILNATGQFSDLYVLLPEDWPQRDQLLRALRRWKFRPASRDGVPIEVKILLAIPQQAKEE